MTKIMLFLLNPEAFYCWFRQHGFYVYKEKRSCFCEEEIMVFLEEKPYQDFSKSEKVSYHRTFNILGKLGLIERCDEYYESAPKSKGLRYVSGHTLTSRGRRLAQERDYRIRTTVKEYGRLIDTGRR